MVFGGISNSGLPQHVLVGENHGLNCEFKDTLFQTDWVNINLKKSNHGCFLQLRCCSKMNRFFFHVCQSEHITKDLLSTISVKNSRPWFAPNVKTSWGLSCAHIAPRGGFDLGQPALHGPWDEGWSNGCPFEVSQNSSAEAPNMYREVPRLSPSKIDVITKENYSKGFRSPPLQIAWNITRTVTNHLSSAPKISRVVEMIKTPTLLGCFYHVFLSPQIVSILCHTCSCSGSSSGPGACFALFGTVWKALCDASPHIRAPCGWGTQHPTWRSWILYLLYNIN